jgi:hypothetical protein
MPLFQRTHRETGIHGRVTVGRGARAVGSPLMTLILVGITLMACHRDVVSKESQLPLVPKGRILVLPPRDMVQGGGFHAVSAGSGTYFLNQLRPRLEQNGWTTSTTANSLFSNTSIPDPNQAIAEGRRAKADYVLRLVLGEFLDAAPMTFRPDYVTLQSAELWSTKNAALVWSISTPMVDQGTNLRSYHRIVDELAEILVRDLSNARVDPTVFTRMEAPGSAVEMPVIQPPSPVNAGDGGRAPSETGSCTIEQILSMKNTGMTDDQVKKACASK